MGGCLDAAVGEDEGCRGVSAQLTARHFVVLGRGRGRQLADDFGECSCEDGFSVELLDFNQNGGAMKKLLVFLSIMSTLLVTGCCLEPPNPWAGIHYQQANEWRSIGVSPPQARQFMVNGFTAIDAKPWIQMGINDPNTVLSWHREGFSPKEAKTWLSKNFTLQQAIEYRSKGLSIAQ